MYTRLSLRGSERRCKGLLWERVHSAKAEGVGGFLHVGRGKTALGMRKQNANLGAWLWTLVCHQKVGLGDDPESVV